MDDVRLTVSDFVDLTNQTLEYAYPQVSVEGEISEFKVIQNKWISFKLKDDGASVSCFASVYQLRIPLEDGMKILVTAAPRLNNKGYFTLNIKAVRPVGEGSIKKGFELLKAKLEAEGLFAPERKRSLPMMPAHIAVIASTESAGYADFIKIINDRWGGLRVTVAHTQVQGVPAPDQMIRALRHLNCLEVLPELIVIIRGGGSAEDLSTFNDEPLVRAIAESRIPTLVGVGHEIDHTLADMVSDVRAATPTNAAQIIVPDRREIIRAQHARMRDVAAQVVQSIDREIITIKQTMAMIVQTIEQKHRSFGEHFAVLRSSVRQLDPSLVLRRGYALITGEHKIGSEIMIELQQEMLTAEVTHVKRK